ncbi:MAG: hypothetical protein Q9222_007161 [Ikaeria aurantiellina]
MPCYLEFLSVFGLSKDARELRFSGFREQTMLKTPSGSMVCSSLGRSGRQFQICYNIKGVTWIEAGRTAQWSIRQAAFHHQFDVDEGTTLWIVTKGTLDIKDRVQHLTGKDGRPEDRAFDTPEQCFNSSLIVHLLNCYWSTENWRWYIQYLEDAIDNETSIAVRGPRGREEAQRIFYPADFQSVQSYQDKINEAIMILEANRSVLESLKNFYEALLQNDEFPLRIVCRQNILSFIKQMDEMIQDSKMQDSRASLLLRITSDRKDLVREKSQSKLKSGGVLYLLAGKLIMHRSYSISRVRQPKEWKN